MGNLFYQKPQSLLMQVIEQPKSCDNMQVNFLQNFPREKQQKLMERWFNATAKLSQIDTRQAIEEKLAKAEQRRLATRNNSRENVDEKITRVQSRKIDLESQRRELIQQLIYE